MISFSCNNCGKKFQVREEFAGRSARCKGCGAKMRVPVTMENALALSAAVDKPLERPMRRPPPKPMPLGARKGPPAPPPKPVKVPMRTRRLRADAEEMASAFRGFESIKVEAVGGEPAELYRVQYNVKGLERGADGKPMPREFHEIEIQLTSEYPRVSPKCKMLTAIFHPNIDPATICVGDHWTAGERLVDLVIRIGEMIAYQAYNIKSPLNAEAAMWADLNAAQLPVDSRDLRPKGME